MGYTHTSDEMDRRVPVLLQFLVPGKSRHRSTPITACRTQRRSAPSLLGATLVATVTINVQTREPSPSLYLSPSLRLSVYYCLSLGACNCSASLYPHQPMTNADERNKFYVCEVRCTRITVWFNRQTCPLRYIGASIQILLLLLESAFYL